MCLPRIPLDLLDESLLVARVALEPAVALKNLLPDFKESSSLLIAGPARSRGDLGYSLLRRCPQTAILNVVRDRNVTPA
jgi:hypothetical protein